MTLADALTSSATQDDDLIRAHHPELVFLMDVEGQCFEIIGDLHDDTPQAEGLEC